MLTETQKHYHLMNELKPLNTVWQFELINEYFNVRDGEVVITVSEKFKHCNSAFKCLFL